MIRIAFLPHERGGLRLRRERMRQQPPSFEFAGLRTGPARARFARARVDAGGAG